MPIPRDRLNSTVKSTSNSRSIPLNRKNFISSEDDLFEKSASQSASRQTRTINHVVPKEVSKKLANDFEAVAGADHNMDKENMKPNSGSSLTNVKRSVSRPLVKRAVSKASHTSSHSPHLTTGVQVITSSHSSSVTKISLSARKEIIDIDGTGADDPIFDVPVTSPSPPRTVNLDLKDMRTMNENNSVMLSTPSKTSKLVMPIGSLSTPSKAMAAPVHAVSRRTPLTIAEKRKRQEAMTALDKSTKTNISLFKKEEELVKNEDLVENINKETVEVDKQVEISDFVEVLEILNSSPKKVKIQIDEVIKEKRENHNNSENIENIERNENIEHHENIKPAQKTKKKKIYFRTQATESAPPDIKGIPEEIQGTLDVVDETPKVEAVNPKIETVDAKIEADSDNLSLVIQVPAPPKLEDLETLDPELYVKLKSGSLKDDPNVPFISETDRIDIESFLETFSSPELAKNLLPVAIIGEGTFSTVYKVIDKNFYECDNSAWTEYSRQNPLDWLRLWRWVYKQEPVEKFVLFRDGKRCVDRNGKGLSVRTMTPAASSTATAAAAKKSSKLAVLLRRYLLEWAMRSLESLLPNNNDDPSEAVLTSISPRALQSAMLRFRPYFIALKRINATSSPQRILDEMSFLKHLGGKNNVVPLINGLRCEDQVLVTFPYFYSDDFREFMGMQSFSINNIACYMRCLFISLAHLHAHNIIHRDVKPSNFLYAPEGGGRAVLLDFGLAQKASNSQSSNSRGNQRHAHVLTSSTQQQQQLQQQRINTSRNNEKERKKLQAVNLILSTINVTGLEGGDPCEKMIQLTGQLGPGYFNNDPRAAMKASRAGTRGFRAPEVLFKSPNQTTALDIWSAGVILLTLLTRRYPFFHSSDDFDAIVEIANIFGNEEMAAVAKLYGRKWTCNVPSVPVKHVTWPVLCEKLNPSFLSEIPEECYDLLKECLNLNSEKRITARNALKHPFIIKFAK